MYLNSSASKTGLAFGLACVAAVLSLLSIWFHLPGQVSMDSSMQLYEASIGKSITWNPPYMTAMIRWLGGGPMASSWLVILNSVLTYLSLSTLAIALLTTQASIGDVAPKHHGHLWLRGLAVVLVLANPILFLYVGIIWKDVLFSSLLMLGVSLGLGACVVERRLAMVLAILSAVTLAITMKVRQQGIFMSPLLLLVPMLALTMGRNLPRAKALGTCALIAALFVVSSMAMSALVARTIHTDSNLGNSVGYRGIMQYDIAGTIALSQTPTAQLPIPMTERLRSDIRKVYRAERGDFMWYSPAVTQWLALPTYEGIEARWITLVRNEPRAFIQHKIDVFKAILNVEGVKACLPIHVGIDGNHEYLREIGFEPGVDAHDRFLYGVAQSVIHWPIYRHWVYVIALFGAIVLLLLLPMQRRLKFAALVVAFATAMLYLSFLPTSIACDFRYLYAGICLVSMLWVVVLTGATGLPRRRERAPGGQS